MPGILSWLKNAISNLGNWFGTAPGYNREREIFEFGDKPTPTPTPIPRPTPTPTPAPTRATPEMLQAGFQRWGGGQAPPVATKSAQLSQAGEPLPDPFLPAILSLLESRGLLDPMPAEFSNPFNIMNEGNLVRYPNLDVSILGGGEQDQLGLAGLLRPGGLYGDYLQGGNLEDFFRVFSNPEAGNPPIEEQIRRYNLLRDIFVQ